jgi:hypothetical protein
MPISNETLFLLETFARCKPLFGRAHLTIVPPSHYADRWITEHELIKDLQANQSNTSSTKGAIGLMKTGLLGARINPLFNKQL